MRVNKQCLTFTGIVVIETTTRSLVKTLSWRISGGFTTLLLIFFLSGNIELAGTVAVAQLIINTILFFLHERVWNRIKWGRR